MKDLTKEEVVNEMLKILNFLNRVKNHSSFDEEETKSIEEACDLIEYSIM